MKKNFIQTLCINFQKNSLENLKEIYVLNFNKKICITFKKVCCSFTELCIILAIQTFLYKVWNKNF